MRYLRPFIALLFGAQLLIFPAIVSADIGIVQSQLKPDTTAQEDRAQVQKAYEDWTLAVQNAKGDPAGVVALYAPNAILLATLSPKIKRNLHDNASQELFDFSQTDLIDYFKDFTSLKGIHATTEKLYTQLFDDVAINTGLYTFEYVDDHGKTIDVPARFTFVYEKLNGQWMIINHHSSLVPEKMIK